MRFLDENLDPIEYTEMYWLGNFFGLPAKQSMFAHVFSKYLPDTTAVLITGGELTQKFNGIVIEDRCNHPSDIYHPNEFVTLASGFNFKEFPRTFKNTDIFYFPFWLFFSKIAQEKDTTPFSDTRSYNASCVNRNPRMARVYNLLELSKRPYYDSMYKTFAKTVMPHELMHTHSVHPDFVNKIVDEFGESFFEEFFKVYDNLPYSNFNLHDELTHCARVYEAGWADSYLNIATTASIENDGFLCEKVFKPFRAEQLFLFQAPPNTVAYLRTIGFDMMDDYIDHGRYDGVMDWRERTSLMLEVLDEIYYDIPNIFLATKSRRVYNREYLKSQELENLFINDILNCIQTKGK